MATPNDNIVPLTGNPLIDGLLQGSAWQFGGAAHNLTYSLSLNDNPNGGPWSTALANAMRGAFNAWSNVANITFSEMGNGAVYTQSTADIAVVLTGNELISTFGATGLGIFPSPSFADTLLSALGMTRTDYPKPEGDIGLDNYYSAFSYVNSGGLGFSYMIHEIGHALGLKHPFDDGGNYRPTFTQLGISAYDNTNYTVMSYTSPTGIVNEAAWNPSTPMPLDILAIQQIYGANMAYHTGDDVYYLTQSGATYTIWDAGGVDTLDASGQGFTNVHIDLHPGAFNTVGNGVVAIAYGVTIEKAIGAQGADILAGNAADNTLYGMGGNDTLDGGEGLGSDYLDGGPGNDVMQGGDGYDTYVVDSPGDTVWDIGGVDTVLSSVSFNLTGTNADILTLTGTTAINATGDSRHNELNGNDGNNILDGNGGGDLMRGGKGNDTYIVSDYGDVIVEQAGEGTDIVYSSVNLQHTSPLADNVENLTLTGTGDLVGTGNTLNNLLIGNAGNNMLDGGLGADTLTGGVGNDSLDGGLGIDTAVFSGMRSVYSIIHTGPTWTVTHLNGGVDGTDTLTGTEWLQFSNALINLLADNTDYNNDAQADILWRNSVSNEVVLWQMDGTGAKSVGAFGTVASAWQIVDSGSDYNADGKADLLWRNSVSNEVVLWQMNGTGAKSVGAFGTVSSDWQIVDSSSDYNADGKADLLWRNSVSNEVVLWQMNGTAAKSVGAFGTVSSDWQIVDSGSDYNADGKADLLWRNSVSNEVVLWQMNGTGAKSVGAFGTVSSDWQIVDSGSDYNADGKADLLWRNSVSNEVVLWQMDGTGAKSVGAFGTVASDWQIVDSGSDYNADGKADLLWRNSVSNEVVLWQMDGTGAKSVGAFGTVASAWQIVDSGSDYNADGKADLLWRNDTTNEVVLWQMDGTGAKSVGAFGTVASAWQIVDSGSDYNADGKADLLWRNDTTNEVVLWQMDGAAGKTVGAFGSVASDWMMVMDT